MKDSTEQTTIINEPEKTIEQDQHSDEQSLEQLHEQIRSCRRCASLFGFEPRPVVRGNENARIVQISQAPGRLVHEIGRPFSDPSGKRLRQSWYRLSEEQFYDPDNFYFAVMGHCYPGKGKTGDRKPPKVCYDLWTSRELDLLKNARLYLVVGMEAASRLFPGRKLDDLVFADLTLHGKPCFVLPHPSGLNRGWFGRHPEFEEKRILQIRQAVYEALDLPLSQMESYVPPERESWQKKAPAGRHSRKAKNQEENGVIS